MATVHSESHTSQNNPLDLVEEMVVTNRWTFDRASDEELVVELPGRWCDYRMFFAWHREVSAMQFSCALDMKVPKTRRQAVTDLLAIVNEQLWVGHFDVSSEGGVPVYRQTTLLRGLSGASIEQFEDMVGIALSECERYYPAFQFVVWGGKNAREAASAALLETVGEA